MQRVHGVEDLFVGALDPAADQHLAVQFRLPVTGGELPQLVDQRLGFARRDKLAGVNGVYQQFEFREFKQRFGHIITAAPAPELYDLEGGAGQIVQRVQVAVHALALRLDAPFVQFFHQLRHAQRDVFHPFHGSRFPKGPTVSVFDLLCAA